MTKKPVTPADPATFREKVEAGQFVVTVEVDPPHGLSPKKALEGAKLLQEVGVFKLVQRY